MREIQGIDGVLLKAKEALQISTEYFKQIFTDEGDIVLPFDLDGFDFDFDLNEIRVEDGL